MLLLVTWILTIISKMWFQWPQMRSRKCRVPKHYVKSSLKIVLVKEDWEKKTDAKYHKQECLFYFVSCLLHCYINPALIWIYISSAHVDLKEKKIECSQHVSLTKAMDWCDLFASSLTFTDIFVIGKSARVLKKILFLPINTYTHNVTPN